MEKYRVYYNHFDSNRNCTTGFKDVYADNEEEAEDIFIRDHEHAPGDYEPTEVKFMQF